MRTPSAAGIETEYGITVLGASAPDPIVASRLVLSAYRALGRPFAPCETYTGMRLPPWQPGAATANELEADDDDPGALMEGPDDDLGDVEAAEFGADEGPTSLMLGNGGRFYIDHTHPEYSTPECRSIRTLVAADKAGERILAECQRYVNTQGLLPDGQELVIYKNNSDHKGHSYGCHENYLLSARLYEHLLYSRTHQMFRYLLPFLVTRCLLCGAGKVGAENYAPGAGYQLSQRADFFESLIGAQTTYNRPLFNTRDEPHAERNSLRRLHVILGDANLSEHATFLKVGTTRLVLDMLADDFLHRDLTLADPVDAYQIVSRDLSFSEPLLLESGERRSALSLQRFYLRKCRAYLQQIEGSDEQWEIWGAWKDVLDALPQNWASLARRLDWATKRRILEHYLAIKGTSWEEVRAWQPIIEISLELVSTSPALEDVLMPRRVRIAAAMRRAGLDEAEYQRQRDIYFGLRRLELDYHDIRHQADSEQEGTYNRLRRAGSLDTLGLDDDIRELITAPPHDTRAWLRGSCVARYTDQIVEASWSKITFRLAEDKADEAAPRFALAMPDPLAPTREQLHPVWEQFDTPLQMLAYFASANESSESDEEERTNGNSAAEAARTAHAAPGDRHSRSAERRRARQRAESSD